MKIALFSTKVPRNGAFHRSNYFNLFQFEIFNLDNQIEICYNLLKQIERGYNEIPNRQLHDNHREESIRRYRTTARGTGSFASFSQVWLHSTAEPKEAGERTKSQSGITGKDQREDTKCHQSFEARRQGDYALSNSKNSGSELQYCKEVSTRQMMGRKEKLQKELDLILEKMRFWRYVIFGIVSGVLGIIISLSQQKLHLNSAIIFILIFGLIGAIISVKRIDALTKEYKELLDLLEKEE